MLDLLCQIAMKLTFENFISRESTAMGRQQSREIFLEVRGIYSHFLEPWLCGPFLLKETYKFWEPVNFCLPVSTILIGEFVIHTLQHTLQHTATHCNTLQHAATRCNALQHAATHCNTPKHSATHCNTLQHALQEAATHFETL